MNSVKVLHQISVTQQDIMEGERNSSQNCAVAIALRRSLQTVFVSVCDASAEINGRQYALPNHVTQFISDFDLDILPEPMQFELAIDEPLEVPQCDATAAVPLPSAVLQNA